jgi:hypothetical protein
VQVLQEEGQVVVEKRKMRGEDYNTGRLVKATTLR